MKANNKIKYFLWVIALLLFQIIFAAKANYAASQHIIEKEVIYCDNPNLSGYLALPAGEWPFAAVIYNHGGFENMIGGAPEETARELAKAGYVGFSPIRREEMSMDGNLQDILAATDYLKGLQEVDKDRIAIMGFSRGGLLALLTAINGLQCKAIVVMAPAPGKGHIQEAFQQIEKISAPVLLLVAENDNKQANHVEICQKLERAMRSNGKQAQLIIYPAFASDGHKMFFEIGAYWQDVLEFLKEHL